MERAFLKAAITAASIFVIYHAGQGLQDYAHGRSESAKSQGQELIDAIKKTRADTPLPSDKK